MKLKEKRERANLTQEEVAMRMSQRHETINPDGKSYTQSQVARMESNPRASSFYDLECYRHAIGFVSDTFYDTVNGAGSYQGFKSFCRPY